VIRAANVASQVRPEHQSTGQQSTAGRHRANLGHLPEHTSLTFVITVSFGGENPPSVRVVGNRRFLLQIDWEISARAEKPPYCKFFIMQ
jgi:hypothetical protein